MLSIKTTKQFEKDLARIVKRNKDITKIEQVVSMLEHQKELPRKNKEHKLTGNYIGKRECHIEPDWLLIYKTTATHLYLARTGTHADLFK